MFRVSLKPLWQLERGGGETVSPRLIELLVHIHEGGSLAVASRKLNLSYRYAWGLLREAEQGFGMPLVKGRRGRGAVLSPLGEKLVWADRRISARLTPVFDSLASEVETELERVLSHTQGILRLHASHGFAVEAMQKHFQQHQMPLDLKYCSSTEAVAAIGRAACELAGFHVPVGRFQKPLLELYEKHLRKATIRLIHLATRRQGLMTAPSNPKQVYGMDDLLRPNVRFINRQPGAGTRMLIDTMMNDLDMDKARVRGYDTHEFTHAAVAAYVASGMADVGFGVETPAKRFGLTFLPLISERYFFACRADVIESAQMKQVLTQLRSAEFRAAINALPGYDAMASGEVLTLAQAFPR